MRLSYVLLVAAGCVAPVSARAADTAQCMAASDQGQELRDKGAYRRARAAFTTCARDACPFVIRRDCTQWLTEVEQIAPTVVVSAHDPDGNDLAAVRVRLDDEVLEEAADGKPILVDAGEHTFRFDAPPWPTVEKRVVLRAGEKTRILDVRFTSGTSRPRLRAEEVAPPSESRSPARSTSIPTVSWILGGVALAAFGSEAYFGLSGLSARSSARSQPCAPSCPPSDVDSVRTKFIVADVSLGIGVLALAGAVYFWLTQPTAPSPSTAAR